MATVGQRGKFAEGKVKAWMTKRSDAEAAFWMYRYPDPRAGSLQAVPADFGALRLGVPYLVEVKEVDHDFRLPAKNFSADKVARMNKFRIAGGECWVVIYHRTTKLWRLAPILAFAERLPSWDLTAYDTFPTHAALLDRLFGS
jgi:hypothetical protein